MGLCGFSLHACSLAAFLHGFLLFQGCFSTNLSNSLTEVLQKPVSLEFEYSRVTELYSS